MLKDQRPSLYARVCLLWAGVFVVVGMVFAFFPFELTSLISAIAGAIGLKGSVTTAGCTLWHVLSLSLMAAIACAAFFSARHPDSIPLFATLIAAKLTSVAGFTFLTVTTGSAWILCAAADAFVAATFIVARTFSIPAKRPLIPGWIRRTHPVAPHFEVYFGKLGISPGVAFWFRYTIFAGTLNEAASWAILFADGKITTGKTCVPISEIPPAGIVIIPDKGEPSRFSGKTQVFHHRTNHLDEGNAVGTAGNIGWDLSFADSGRRHVHAPRLLAELGLVKGRLDSCFIDINFSGEISVEDRILKVAKAPGMIGHISGSRLAKRWAWAHANVFTAGENAAFEALTATIQIAGRERAVSSFVLFVNERKFTFSGLKQMFRSSSRYQRDSWRFHSETADAVLDGELSAPLNSSFAIVTYTDTDGSALWCRNSKLADLTLTLTDKRHRVTTRLTASGTTAFETVDRDPPAEPANL